MDEKNVSQEGKTAPQTVTFCIISSFCFFYGSVAPLINLNHKKWEMRPLSIPLFWPFALSKVSLTGSPKTLWLYRKLQKITISLNYPFTPCHLKLCTQMPSVLPWSIYNAHRVSKDSGLSLFLVSHPKALFLMMGVLYNYDKIVIGNLPHSHNKLVQGWTAQLSLVKLELLALLQSVLPAMWKRLVRPAQRAQLVFPPYYWWFMIIF